MESTNAVLKLFRVAPGWGSLAKFANSRCPTPRGCCATTPTSTSGQNCRNSSTQRGLGPVSCASKHSAIATACTATSPQCTRRFMVTFRARSHLETDAFANSLRGKMATVGTKLPRRWGLTPLTRLRNPLPRYHWPNLTDALIAVLHFGLVKQEFLVCFLCQLL